LWPSFDLPRPSVAFGFAQFVSFRSSSFVDLLSLFSTLFDLLQASFGLLPLSATFSSFRIQVDLMNSFHSRSFFDVLSFLILTVFDEEAHIGNSKQIKDKEQIGTGDRIDNEDEIEPVNE
jgi:hypothetical protein